jgi:hypothetical protein
MKKIIPLLMVLLFGVTSCKKDPVNPPSDTNTTLVGTLTENKTLTADKVWSLKGYVYIPQGITLTVEPGTKVISDVSEKGALCVERGGKIIADGTADKPIIFTSGQSTPKPGDWGGLIILGNAPTNKPNPTIEGGVGRAFGGVDENDNSGILRYVRVEYAGIAAFPGSEINAFTFGGVGKGTVVDYCESYYANDDAFEFFGGNVNCSHLVAVGTADDDYDFDFGYTGTIKFAISKRDPQFVDMADAGNGIECDNDGTGSVAIPLTKPNLQNFTLIGSIESTSLPNHNLAMRWRRGTAFNVQYSIFYGYMKGGFSVESDITAGYFNTGMSTMFNNYISSVDTVNTIKTSSTLLTKENMLALCTKQGTIVTISQVKPFDNNFQTISSVVNGQWGAIPSGSSIWTLGWTKF